MELLRTVWRRFGIPIFSKSVLQTFFKVISNFVENRVFFQTVLFFIHCYLIKLNFESICRKITHSNASGSFTWQWTHLILKTKHLIHNDVLNIWNHLNAMVKDQAGKCATWTAIKFLTCWYACKHCQCERAFIGPCVWRWKILLTKVLNERMNENQFNVHVCRRSIGQTN